jgi:hypothetical protein
LQLKTKERKVKIETKMNCPLNNFEPCKLFDCAWFIQLQGTNPNTGRALEEWGCSVAWLPMLLVEHSQMERQTGAAVESFRNEMVKANEASQRLLRETAKITAVDSNEPKLIGDSND